MTKNNIQEQLRKEYPSSDSELSDPPEPGSARYISTPTYNEPRRQLQEDLGGEGTTPRASNATNSASQRVATSSAPSNEQHDEPSSPRLSHMPPSTRHALHKKRKLNAAEIDDAIGGTPAQSREFYHSIQKGMKARGLLGMLDYSKLLVEEQIALNDLYAEAKASLPFLFENGLTEQELDHVLYERAKLSNRNEKHNDRMVKTGKVRRRAGTEELGIVPEEEGHSDHTMFDGAGAASGNKFSQLSTNTPKEGRRASAPAWLTDRPDADSSSEQAKAEANAPSSLMGTDSDAESEKNPLDHAKQKLSWKDELLPTFYHVRILDSDHGASLHRSQLLKASGNDGNMRTAESLRFSALVALINAEVGNDIDVRERLVADVSGTRLATRKNTRWALRNSEDWLRVLRVWQSTRHETVWLHVCAEEHPK